MLYKIFNFMLYKKEPIYNDLTVYEDFLIVP